jgi:hypothetical protein
VASVKRKGPSKPRRLPNCLDRPDARNLVRCIIAPLAISGDREFGSAPAACVGSFPCPKMLRRLSARSATSRCILSSSKRGAENSAASIAINQIRLNCRSEKCPGERRLYPAPSGGKISSQHGTEQPVANY